MNDKPPSILLDGAILTNLHTLGMPRGVCAEKWILDNPDKLKALQSEFVNSGSGIIYAPTASANRPLLSRFGLETQVCEINKKLVSLSKEISNGKKVAGVMSMTGLLPEPYGEIPFDELVDIYREQADALYKGGADLFVIESMTSLIDSRAAVLACREYKIPVYVTVFVDEKGELSSGATPMNIMITLQELGISAFGINRSSIEVISEELSSLKPFAKIPLIAKPSAGESNLLIPDLYDLSPVKMAEAVKQLLDNGASIIGGDCGATPEHIGEIYSMLLSYVPKAQPEYHLQNNDMLLSDEQEIFALDNDRLELTEPVSCEYDMADVFIQTEDDSNDVIYIKLETEEEAYELSQNAHYASLPVCISTNNPAALERALFLYNGLAMVDRQSEIPEDVLSEIAKKYGAVLY